jgi:ferredoxin-thioredoxin reductase catalytic subunit
MKDEVAALLTVVREIARRTGYYMTSDQEFYPPVVQVPTELWHRLRLLADQIERHGRDDGSA